MYMVQYSKVTKSYRGRHLLPLPVSQQNRGPPCSWVSAQSFNRVWLFATPWTVAHQAPLSMRFSRQEHWDGSHAPSRGSSQSRDWDFNLSLLLLLQCRQVLYPLSHLGSPIPMWIHICMYYGASLVAQLVKNPPAMQEIPVQFLGREDPLEKG